MTESEFQSAVVELAKLTNHKHYHTHNSRRSVPGFPDLVLVHRVTGRVVFAELKAEKGRVSPAQTEWLAARRPQPGLPVAAGRPGIRRDRTGPHRRERGGGMATLLTVAVTPLWLCSAAGWALVTLAQLPWLVTS